MSHVATLVAAPGVLLDDAFAGRAAAVLRCTGPRRLDAGAVDLPFAPPAGSDNARLTAELREALGGAPVDVVVQRAAGRRKRLFIADMDSTIIEQECIDELADGLGIKAEVAAITERSMRGEIAFEPALRERVALLRGLDVATATRTVTERISLTPGARTLARTMRAHGALTVIASGGFTIFTAHVAQLAGFERHYANVLGIEGGRLSGLVHEPIFGRASKRTTLIALRDEVGLAPEQTLAVGDGANDLAMLEEAGLGVAFRAKPAVAAVARARIDHGDLTALLYLQGFAREEFRD
ncbi:Phosphoserine phosphatase SerB [Beijerinckiaceae bacterium RH AL1]|nr:phosphoserine phosphatase SerB [Beijerinckiaceae bacterium]VVB47344.1 Phosphoserine phosphatase SerB [Beijerinckiaceae bacterium RH CH11]VVB47427.1 Phosphoserine phosphatase SerB [Beijerinckiaceae bacterium RH AL8]VVC55840.1 Phosphoserine phosphatase SerB [Beijerinckiaceae bacterium RH AL1]